MPVFEAHRQTLEAVYSDPDADYEGVSAFFFQPEAIPLYARLQHDRDQLHPKWNEGFPDTELEPVAENFGFGLQ